MYINLALLLWSFRIAQRPDALINTAVSDEVIPLAAPFEVDFVPRVEVAKLREIMTEYVS